MKLDTGDPLHPTALPTPYLTRLHSVPHQAKREAYEEMTQNQLNNVCFITLLYLILDFKCSVIVKPGKKYDIKFKINNPKLIKKKGI